MCRRLVVLHAFCLFLVGLLGSFIKHGKHISGITGLIHIILVGDGHEFCARLCNTKVPVARNTVMWPLIDIQGDLKLTAELLYGFIGGRRDENIRRTLS